MQIYHTFSVRLKSSSSSSAAPSSMPAPPSTSGAVHTMQCKHACQTLRHQRITTTQAQTTLTRCFLWGGSPVVVFHEVGHALLLLLLLFQRHVKELEEQTGTSVNGAPSIPVQPWNIAAGNTRLKTVPQYGCTEIKYRYLKQQRRVSATDAIAAIIPIKNTTDILRHARSSRADFNYSA